MGKNSYGSRFIILLMLLLLLLLLPVPLARADGGAPQRAYVAGVPGGVGVIDIGQQKMTQTISTPEDPPMVTLSYDGRFLYVPQPQAGQLTIIGAKDGNQVCTVNLPGHPNLVALDPGANILFAAATDATRVTSLDTANCTVKHTFEAHEPVNGIAIAGLGTSLSANSGNQLWVSGKSGATVFDDVSGKQVSTVSIPEGPHYLSIPPGGTVYATTQQGSVIGIDLNTHKVTPLISGGSYGPMDFDETTGEVYVPDKQNKQIVVLAPLNSGMGAPHEPARKIALGVQPESIAITSDGALGFAALDGGNVAMLDIPGRNLIATINVGGNPHFIITGLNPPLFGTTPQQASILTTVFSIGAYVIVAALLIIPILLFRRYAKARAASDALEQSAEGNDLSPLPTNEEVRSRSERLE